MKAVSYIRAFRFLDGDHDIGGGEDLGEALTIGKERAARPGGHQLQLGALGERDPWHRQRGGRDRDEAPSIDGNHLLSHPNRFGSQVAIAGNTMMITSSTRLIAT
jgi:hypothetical protein